MSAAKYSEEEIERKRLLALEKRKEIQSKLARNSSEIVRPSTSTAAAGGKSRKDEGNASVGAFPAARNRPKVSSVAKKDVRYNPIGASTVVNKRPDITGKCYMIDGQRFAVETSTFFPPIIEIFKKLSSRQYDPQTRMWNFHLNDYQSFVEMIGKLPGIRAMGPIPSAILRIFKESLTSSDDASRTDLTPIDPKLTSSLMAFQREGVCYGISKNGRCIIADDMGLGKTIQALGIAHYYRNDWPLLIVTLSSIRYQWSEAIYTFLPSVPSHYISHVTTAKDSYISNAKIVIVSYDLLVRAVDAFKRHPFGVVIIDESHSIKSHKTARYKAVKSVASQAERIVLLSGTPALSRPIELYSQVRLVLPQFVGFQEYGARYCDGKKLSFGWDYSGSSNLQELQALLKACCMIRRLKSDVLGQLPSKMRQVIILDPELIEVGTKDMEAMSKRLQKETLKGIDRHSALLRYYGESSVAKSRAICNYVSNLLEKKTKFLVFAHHQNVLDAITQLVVSRNVRYIRIDGRTSAEQRKLQVDRFQEREDCLVAILSITAANSGITLTAARLVVFAELFWNPGILCQAEDRVHRLGQKDSVLVQYLVAKRTADDYIWPLIEEKMRVLSSAGLEQNFSLSAADVRSQSPSRDGSRQRKLSFHLNDSIIPPDISSDATGMKETEVASDALLADEGETDAKAIEAIEAIDFLDIDEEAFASCDWDSIE